MPASVCLGPSGVTLCLRSPLCCHRFIWNKTFFIFFCRGYVTDCLMRAICSGMKAISARPRQSPLDADTPAGQSAGKFRDWTLLGGHKERKAVIYRSETLCSQSQGTRLWMPINTKGNTWAAACFSNKTQRLLELLLNNAWLCDW